MTIKHADGSEETEIPLAGDPDPQPAPNDAFVPAEPDEAPSDLVTLDDQDPSQQDEDPVKKKTAKDRRNERYDRIVEERDLAKQERDQARQQMAHLQGQIDALRNQPPPQPAAPAVDPEEQRKSQVREELQAIAQRRTAILAEATRLQAGEKLDAATQKRLEDEDFDLQVKFSSKAAELSRPQQPQTPQLSPADMEAAVMRQNVRMAFPDVADNPQAQGWAQGRYHQLIAEGHQAGWGAVQQAWADARQRFAPTAGAPPAPPPQYQPPYYQPQPSPYPAPPQPAYMPPGSQSRMQGPPRGEGPSGGQGGPVQIKLSKEQMQAADIIFDYETNPNVRYQRYAQAIKSAVVPGNKAR